MAKLAFSKLGLKVNSDVKTITYGENIIEVRQYLPMNEVIDLVGKVLNQSYDDNGYYNPLRVKVYLTLETVYAYTNLTFTEKMKENELKLYDILISSGLFAEIVKNIPEEEWKDLQNTVWHVISNIYEYKNSAMGVLDVITNDYNDLDLDATDIQQKLADPNNMALLRDVLAKLG